MFSKRFKAGDYLLCIKYEEPYAWQKGEVVKVISSYKGKSITQKKNLFKIKIIKPIFEYSKKNEECILDEDSIKLFKKISQSKARLYAL